jgi:hypothetical protein
LTAAACCSCVNDDGHAAGCWGENISTHALNDIASSIQASRM